jgi:hypothetical protein
MGTTSGETGTDSCFSCGSTSQNHPTHPMTVRIAPRILTVALVTSPANNKATPKAATIGHAVGAGNSILLGTRVFSGCELILRPFPYRPMM